MRKIELTSSVVFTEERRDAGPTFMEIGLRSYSPHLDTSAYFHRAEEADDLLLELTRALEATVAFRERVAEGPRPINPELIDRLTALTARIALNNTTKETEA